MAGEKVFDVMLFGYRNDVARARTLEFLDRLPSTHATPARIDRHTGLPQRVFAALTEGQAQTLRGALEACGAQVTLLEASGVETAHGAPPPAVRPVDSPGATRRIRPFTLVLVALLGAAAFLWRTLQPPPPAEMPIVPDARAPLSHLAAIAVVHPEAVQLNSDAVRLAESKSFPEAAAQLEAARRLAPNDETITRNLQNVLLNWAIADMAAERLDEAAERLRDADQLGERADVLRALGIVELRRGEVAHAAATLERALQLAPSDTSAILALSEAYVQRDQRAQALDLLHRAKEAGAHSPDLEKKLQQLGREVDAEWDFVQLESAHFRVSFADDQNGRVVDDVLGAFEDAYASVGAKLNVYPDGRTPIVLYTQQDFHSVTQTPDWAGAAFDGRIKLPVRGLRADDAGLLRVARHEYAHAVIVQLSNARCPVWLNEGLAVWAEEEEEGEREAWAAHKVAGQRLFTFDELNRSFVHLPAARAEVAYAQSYLAVRALVDDYGARRIPLLLGALRQHGLREAFAATYPHDLASFEDHLLRSLTS
jgi:tetratricopeptide (TPR) repeat protein